MSELENLIQRLCPDGVEYKTFDSVATFVRGITYSKGQERQDGIGVKVLRANNITLDYNTLNFDDVKVVDNNVKIKEEQYLKKDDILICAGSGSKAHIGKVAYVKEDIDYSFGGFMGVIRVTKDFDSRFMFHILTSGFFKQHLDVALNSSTINNLNAQIMKSFSIPVPPIEVQREIVRILDNFTELTAELTAELEARKKQYEYYRDKLLSFDAVNLGGGTDLKQLKLGTICHFVYGKGNTIPKQAGEYPVYGCNGVVGATNMYNSEDAPIIGHIGSAGVVNWGQGKHFVTYNGTICSANKEYILSKYLYHLLCKLHLEKLVKGSQPYLSYSDFENIYVLIPLLAEQERIVKILDRFDKLCNDIAEGLPAEIEARKKQYEYYRDKLLSFKEKVA